jgi:hypothetical protein
MYKIDTNAFEYSVLQADRLWDILFINQKAVNANSLRRYSSLWSKAEGKLPASRMVI